MITFHKKVLREKANYNSFIMENLNSPFLKKIGYYYSTLTLVQCSDGYTYSYQHKQKYGNWCRQESGDP